MSMLELMANSAMLRRFLQVAALGFVGIGELIQRVENTDMTGPEKRREVIRLALAKVREYITQGVVPEQALPELEKTAGQLIDTEVALNNKLGIFEKAGVDHQNVTALHTGTGHTKAKGKGAR